MAHRADIGDDGDLGGKRSHSLPGDQPQRSSPAKPQTFHRCWATPLRDQRDRDMGGGAGNQGRVCHRRGIQNLTDIAKDRHPCFRRPAFNCQRDVDLVLIADIDDVRQFHVDVERSAGQRQYAVQARDDDRHAEIADADRPRLRARKDDRQRQRYTQREYQDGPAGRAHQRGAAVWSRICSTTWSAHRPSISAPGARTTRCRSAGTARNLMSSGMT